MTIIVNGKAVLEALSDPFQPQDIEWRVQTATKKNGKTKVLILPYIESRAVMNRLDLVCGGNWQSQFDKIEVAGKEAFQCRLSIKIGDEWITRTDAAEVSDIESVKGGHSNALKRAAVQWGIGRYLYDCPQYWMELKPSGEHRVWGKFKIGGQYEQIEGYFDTPNLPDWALPSGSKKTSQPKKTSVNNQAQKQSEKSNKKQAPETNEDQLLAVQHVKKLLNSLNVPIKFVAPLLRKCGSQANELEEASLDELRALYKVLAPVNYYVTECKKLKLSVGQMMDTAQITLKVPLDNIHNLYFKMDRPLADETLNLIKADLRIAG